MKPPVVILAGGSAQAVAREVESYSPTLLEAFQAFEGTLISGGTRAGVSVLAGDLGEAYGERITVIGYVPELVPEDVEVDVAKERYHELRRTKGQEFTVLEALQAWADVLSAGLTPAQVTLLGVGGGSISSLEYRLALTLGARCGVLRGSGGAADELLDDPRWRTAVTALAADAASIRRFVDSG
jgi:hypothetical protein